MSKPFDGQPFDDPDRLARAAASDDEEGYERPAPRRLPAEGPLDTEVARSLLWQEAALLEGMQDRLRWVAALLPRSENEDAMAEDLIPHDVPTYMSTTIEMVIGEYVVPGADALRQAAAVNDDELCRQLREKRARLGAEG